jgi:hypothetical protein
VRTYSIQVIFIQNFAPAASIRGPAVVLCVLANIRLGLSLIAFVRQPSDFL